MSHRKVGYALISMTLAAPGAIGQTLFATSADGQLFSVEADSGSTTLIGSTGLAQPAGLAFRNDTGLLTYTQPSDTSPATSALFQLDPTAGGATLIGPLGTDFDFEGGLTLASHTVGYALGGRLASNDTAVYRLDLTTGQATEIGAFASGDVNGLTLRSDGVLVAWTQFGGQLLTFDPATGTTGQLGSSSNLFSTLSGGLTTFDGQLGYLLTSRDGGTSPNNLFSLDLFTGEMEFLATVDTNVRLTGLAVPAPGTAVVVCGAGLLMRRRR